MTRVELPYNAASSNIEILINAAPGETRAAQIESGVLQEIHIQRDVASSSVGNIYLGIVQRVLPGMQAAFIELGTQRAAFLQVSDMVSQPPADKTLRIEKRLQQGDPVVVQVTRDAMGSKGARLTTHLTLPSRFLIYMPYGNRIGVSARIENAEERERLFHYVVRLRQELNIAGSFIVRTAADGVSAPALAADMRFLATLFQDIDQRARQFPVQTRLYSNPPLPIRMLRDLLSPGVTAVLTDNAYIWEEMIAFTRRFAPEYCQKVRLHDGFMPLFTQYGIEDAIQRALQPMVPLKSGGFLIIEQTEAMVTVDVNTGGFVGSRSLEKTVLRTNIEAAQTVARQLRLRNLGGIIVIDFIDMIDPGHKQQVLDHLATALARDPAKTSIGSISSLGLVEVTRKRTRDSLQNTLCSPCEVCHGRGFVKTAATVAFELFREIERRAHQLPNASNGLLILACPDVIDELLDHQAENFRHVCQDIGRTVKLQSEALYGPEQFDVVVI